MVKPDHGRLLDHRSSPALVLAGGGHAEQLSEDRPGHLGPASGAGGTGTETTDDEKLLLAFLQKTVLGGAVLEGAACANLVAFLLEGQVYSIALGFLLLMAILAGFPARGGMEEWLERAARQVQEIRDLSRLSR